MFAQNRCENTGKNLHPCTATGAVKNLHHTAPALATRHQKKLIKSFIGSNFEMDYTNRKMPLFCWNFVETKVCYLERKF